MPQVNYPPHLRRILTTVLEGINAQQLVELSRCAAGVGFVGPSLEVYAAHSIAQDD
jgi:hypothetical protein